MNLKHLEKLARLSLTDTERATMQADLAKMLDMVGKLNELDLDDTPPLVYLSDAVSSLRSDSVQPHLDRATALANAPLADDAHFLVPKVINK